MIGAAWMQTGRCGLHFSHPVKVVVAMHASDVIPALATIEAAVLQHGQHAVGFLSYEAAAAFHLAVHAPLSGLPLLWFALYQEAEPISDWFQLIKTWSGNEEIHDWQPTINGEEYARAVQRVKNYLIDGHSYQVNYTFPLHATPHGDPKALFARLIRAQQTTHAAFIDTGRFVIGSASPELFFQCTGDSFTAKPMKGTAQRGCTLAEDNAQIAALKQSEKNRAENVMIVDMIRNDIGRVATIGSVCVPELFTIERYPTLLQMTSTVTAHTSASVTEILAKIFPCASVTGAPKVRTMEIIRELEQQPRGIYTGAIGYISPYHTAQFNVAIRTFLWDRQQQQLTYGVGSGLVWDSHPNEEYAECLLKARVLTTTYPDFALLESLLWEPNDGYFLQAAHIARLTESALYFGIPVHTIAIKEGLAHLALTLRVASKVRLQIQSNGSFLLEAEPLQSRENSTLLRVGLAKTPIHSRTIWLYHKTTHRVAYAAARAERPECDDVILWNERGELTEACNANLVLQYANGQWVTPPISSGLLAGTFRGHLLSTGHLQERRITDTDLRQAQSIYLINSVRKWQKASLA